MTTTSSNIYQFKIALKFIKPKIWRQIQVPANYTFEDLHVAIQNAIGWENYHLHQFEMVTQRHYGMVIGTNDCDQLDHKATIEQYFLSPKDKALYLYDFGDSWEHEIILEKILPRVKNAKYPQCIKGKRACPPEDCGGVWGYGYLLEIIQNPNHEEYAERIEWLGEKYDPEEFNPKLVVFDNLK